MGKKNIAVLTIRSQRLLCPLSDQLSIYSAFITPTHVTAVKYNLFRTYYEKEISRPPQGGPEMSIIFGSSRHTDRFQYYLYMQLFWYLVAK